MTEGKSPEDIAQDFDGNIKLVRTWIVYMIGIKWLYKNAVDGSWTVSHDGKKWIEKYYMMFHN